jgi:DNA-binding protein HU-beta
MTQGARVNKDQLVDAVTEQIGDRKTAASAVDAVLRTVTRTVSEGEKVALFGFGVFEKVDRAARSARNPATGAAVSVPATSVPRFRPGQGFKDAVSGRTGPRRAATSSADTSSAAAPDAATGTASTGTASAKASTAKESTGKESTAKASTGKASTGKASTAKASTAKASGKASASKASSKDKDKSKDKGKDAGGKKAKGKKG